MTPTLVAMYTYPDQNRYDVWHECPSRSSCTVYIHFSDNWKSGELSRALRAAAEKNTLGIIVSRQHPETSEHFETESPTFDRLTFSVCEFKPYQPHFNREFYAVNHDELIILKPLKDNVSVVSLQKKRYVYKFMTPKYNQISFETEV